MTDPTHSDSPAGRAAEDLAFVRSAIERQRRAVCEIIPLWLAGAISLYVFLIVASRSFLGADAFDSLIIFSGTGMLALIAVYEVRRRRKTGGTPSAKGELEAARQFLPAMVGWVAAIVILKMSAADMGLSDAAVRLMGLLLTGAAFVAGGSSRLFMMAGLGVGCLIGAAALAAGWSESRVVLGAALALGIFGGAWLDHRLVGRKNA